MTREDFQDAYNHRFQRSRNFAGPAGWVDHAEFWVRNNPDLSTMLKALEHLGFDLGRTIFLDIEPGRGDATAISAAFRVGEFAVFDWNGSSISNFVDHKPLREPIASIVERRLAEIDEQLATKRSVGSTKPGKRG